MELFPISIILRTLYFPLTSILHVCFIISSQNPIKFTRIPPSKTKGREKKSPWMLSLLHAKYATQIWFFHNFLLQITNSAYHATRKLPVWWWVPCRSFKNCLFYDNESKFSRRVVCDTWPHSPHSLREIHAKCRIWKSYSSSLLCMAIPQPCRCLQVRHKM